MGVNGTPRVAVWLPYVLVVIPTMLSIIVWLVVPAVHVSSWFVVPVWIAGYFAQRAVLRAVFAKVGLD